MRLLPHNVHAELKAFAEGSASELSPAVLDWFRANRDLALTRPYELYRGKNFDPSEGSFALNGAQQGDMVAYPQASCSTWSSALPIAQGTALRAPSAQTFPEMRATYLADTNVPNSNIGVVLSAVITPEDVVCSLDRVDRYCRTSLSACSAIGDVIIRPKPSMQARIINLYTKQSLSVPGESGLWAALNRSPCKYDNEFPGVV